MRGDYPTLVGMMVHWLGGNDVPERQARALHRPPSWVVASFVRRTVVSALERMEPIEALVVSW